MFYISFKAKICKNSNLRVYLGCKKVVKKRENEERMIFFVKKQDKI